MRQRLTITSVLAVLWTLLPLPALSAPASPVAAPTVSAVVDGLPAARTPFDGGPRGLATFEATDAPRPSLPVETPPFSLVGFELPRAGGEVRFRTSVDGESWTEWQEAHQVEEEGPDPTSAEAGGAAFTEPVWVGEARHLQISVSGTRPTEVGAHLVDSAGLGRSPAGRLWDRLSAAVRSGTPAAEATEHGRPPIVTRAGWGADESIRGGPSYADGIRFSAVHHTVSRNDYSCAESPAIIRGIYRYHVVSRGWKDIGYNFLVDRCGTVFEGRYGGVDRPVIGAHAAGFNTGSFGVSVIGTLTSSYPAPVLEALNAVISWKFALHHVDASTTVEVTSLGSPRYPAGTRVRLNRVVGHRDVGRTSCPGDALYAALPALRDRVRTRTAQLAPHYPSAYGETPFEDIGRSTHAPDIERLYMKSLTAGCADRRYCPDGVVTRGQMATFLARLRGLAPVEGQRFSDVPADHAHARTINAVVDAGLSSGYPDGTYRPDAHLSRAQMAVLLQQALDLQLVDATFFVDIPVDEMLVRPRAHAVRQAGITEGCRWRHYCPADDVTRAQVASFLNRAVESGLISPAEDPSPDPEAPPEDGEAVEEPTPEEEPT